MFKLDCINEMWTRQLHNKDLELQVSCCTSAADFVLESCVMQTECVNAESCKGHNACRTGLCAADFVVDLASGLASTPIPLYMPEEDAWDSDAADWYAAAEDVLSAYASELID